ncbi:ATP-binding protein [Acinetobacter colistiniresistens]|uniref:ATP-binding protein n=1 Tax=Acinetobacter colistiniresistens TaxID=280145 RepID=UPI00211C51EA|nr:ATP-binding protein [Acinetobacter colistiniresistens]UUM28392.1 ATP-binding protein [Acinetobacter colistiniresistens]
MQKYTANDLKIDEDFYNNPFIEEINNILEKINSFNNKEEFENFIIENIQKLKKRFYSIQIIDTGKGMTREELEEVFLVIGTPYKLNKAEENGRVLLGEKGIGRLSMMKLGNKAKVITKTSNDKIGNSIIFDWNKFDNPNIALTDIELTANEIECDFQHGTKIIITDLLSHWDLKKTQIFVEDYIRRLRNPFSADKKNFPINIYQNNKRLRLTSIPIWLTEQANFRAEYIFDPSSNDVSKPWLEGKVTWKDHNSAETRTWFGHELINILGEEKDEDYINYSAILKSLGKFNVTLYWFNRKDLTATLDKTLRMIKSELDKWVGGISIYRDNFRIGFTGGLNDDWLEWDNQALRGQGYTLNRYQTVGALEISKIENPKLQDTANRQSLTESNEFKILKNY